MWRALWLFRPVSVFALMLFLPHVARGGLQFLSHSAHADPQLQQVIFQVTFDRPPDFLSTDEFGNPLNAFQYWYDSEPGGFEFAGEDVVVIRGPEIRFHDAIPVRESINPDGEEFPGAEGWGPMRGMVPFTLDGATLTFVAAWELLGESDQFFAYQLFAFESGELTDAVELAIIVPLPAGVLAGALGLALAYFAWRKSTSTGTRTSFPLSD